MALTAPIEPTLEEIWEAIKLLAQAHGAEPINQFPGLWEHELYQSKWKIAANGHRDPLPYTGRAGIEFTVQPFSLFVEWLDWPAGIITATWAEVAAGAAANTRSLLRAMRDDAHHAKWLKGAQPA